MYSFYQTRDLLYTQTQLNNKTYVYNNDKQMQTHLSKYQHLAKIDD